MTGCNATLDTVTLVPCEHHARLDCRPDVYGGEMVHVTVHTLTCVFQADHGDVHEGRGPTVPERCVRWSDITPGATPHVDPLVSDAEVLAARKSLSMSPMLAFSDLRAALEAAARVRDCTHGIVVGDECKECGRKDVP